MDTRQTSRFSFVSAVYGVQDYLPEFLASLDAQHGGLDDTELIFVIDGSPDDSESIIRRWADATEHRATVIVQENAGPGAARNTGIAAATGEWLSFPDPDDVLAPGYLDALRRFLDDGGDGTDFIAARALRFTTSIEHARDDHPLGYRFRRGSRIASPAEDPKIIHLQISSSFVRREALLRHAPEGFDERVRPTFEDGHLIAKLWLRSGTPPIGLLADAIYYYRQRGDGSSLVQSSVKDVARYLELPRHGYLSLLHEATALGPVPRWLQFLVLYDLQWPFREDHAMASLTSGLDPEVKEEYLGAVSEILEHIEDHSILRFNPTWIPLQIRLAWYVLKTGRLPGELDVSVSRTEAREQLVQLRYYVASAEVHERLLLDGKDARPAYAKIRAVEYFGRTMMFERILWVSALEDIQIFTSDLAIPDRLRFGAVDLPYFEATVSRVWRGQRRVPSGHAAAASAAVPPRPSVVPWSRPVRRAYLALRWRALVAVDRVRSHLREARLRGMQRAVKRDVRRPKVARRYADAWLLMDRDDVARDNAEALYRYLRTHQPQVNAWFVIRRDSPDYRRLRREGFRMVAFGSRRHAVLMRSAAHLISSQANAYVTSPFDETRFGRGTWKFTFLQHGVTKDDLSRWLNPKRIDLVLACTRPEYESFVADGTQYTFTRREVALTGFPRHDELLAAARSVKPSDRDAILIVPTWRNYLLKRETKLGSAREPVEGFWESEYVREWTALISDDRLASLAARTGCRIVFAPHPNLQAHIRPEHLPKHVEYFSYSDGDIKRMIAQARIAITDYSSLGTEAALAGAPLVYFQFDRDEFFRGAHAYRPGYFTAEECGYGPVVYDVQAAIAAIDLLMTDREYVRPYLVRIEADFRFRDESNSERAYLAITSLDLPWYERDQSLFDGTTTAYDADPGFELDGLVDSDSGLDDVQVRSAPPDPSGHPELADA
jgi:glycosyltransferase involved in cell wall biosynthesis/CDP-glycerol glycerophosphotransferase (TagB/SpsB family)